MPTGKDRDLNVHIWHGMFTGNLILCSLSLDKVANVRHSCTDGWPAKYILWVHAGTNLLHL